MNNEQYRPQFHFSPKENWINDPNGLCFYDGEYHLFYQHHPNSKIWGPMHWGHAVSRDLLHWERLPIALFPDDHGQIFSGSIVVDTYNTSGLREGETVVMVAIFTHHKDGHEKQSIAYSRDKGRTWETYHQNPVLRNPGLKDFRDPKVFWHQDKWVMSLACGDHIRFYQSENLLDWTYLSSFGQEYGGHGGVWECPDLIRFQTEAGEKWVLIVSVNPGGPNGGSAIQYFTGSFNGKTFTCDQEKDEVKWADFGRDFYAAVTWSNTSAPLWIGWMNNWQYANEGPTHPFRGSMSIPRNISLKQVDGEDILVQKPVDVTALVEKSYPSELVHPKPGQIFTQEIKKQANIQITRENGYVPFNLRIKGDGEKVSITFDPYKQLLVVDRTELKNLHFSDEFPSIDAMPVPNVDDIQLLIDECSVELFVNDGTKVMTELFYMESSTFILEWEVDEAELHAILNVEELNSIYKKDVIR